jgi:hypothetical protein
MDEDVSADRLQSIDTPERARQYIDHVISRCSAYEILRCVRTFFLPIREHVGRRRPKRGGAAGPPLSCDDDADVRIYKALQLCDSVHDGAWLKVPPDEIMRLLGMTPADLPHGMSVDVLRSEHRTIKFFQKRRALAFGDDKVPNPLYRADIDYVAPADPRAFLDKHSKREGFESLARFYQDRLRNRASQPVRTLTASVITKYHYNNDHRHETLQLRQVLALAYQMRAWFGRSCVFQPDSLHPLTRFVVAINLIGREFYKKYALDHDYGTSRYVSEIQDAVRSAGGSAESLWAVSVCDANVYDAQTVDPRIGLHTSPTGYVFRPEVNVQVHLDGIDKEGSVRAVVTDETGRTRSLKIGGTNGDSAETETSNAVVFARIRDGFQGLSPSALLAMKRAGDWGQVEHCKRYGRVFVTSDALAAAYAFYRSVPFLLLRTRHIEEGDYEHYCCVLGRANPRVRSR